MKHGISEDQRLWAFQPTEANKSLMSKAITRELAKAKKDGVKLKVRGLKTKLINEALRITYGHLSGKREASK